jgi:hypothetical protein
VILRVIHHPQNPLDYYCGMFTLLSLKDQSGPIGKSGRGFMECRISDRLQVPVDCHDFTHPSKRRTGDVLVLRNYYLLTLMYGLLYKMVNSNFPFPSGNIFSAA